VVDDNEIARHTLKEMLLHMKFDAQQTSSGEKAISEILTAQQAGKPYEIVFLDWQMPVMNGIDVAKIICQWQSQIRPHLVIVTAYGREDVIKEAEQIGLEGMLIKPVTASILFDTTLRILGKKINVERVCKATVTQILASIRGARILLVEDNLLNQEVALGLLEEGQFTVDVANNGLEAVNKTAEHSYDIVLMDVQMPVMDGITATGEIRKRFSATALPIIAMTANAMLQDKQNCLKAGMNGHIPKPIDPDELFRVLLEWIGAKSLNPLPMIKPNPRPTFIGAKTEPLPMIAGLDIELGLQRVLGKQTVYRLIIQKFVTGQKITPNQIHNALAEKDWESAERCAHSSKSAAANIGAMPLAELAAQLETALRHRLALAEIEPLLTAWEQAQTALIEAIETHMLMSDNA
jgi:CheY-like chemotaxis protein